MQQGGLSGSIGHHGGATTAVVVVVVVVVVVRVQNGEGARCAKWVAQDAPWHAQSFSTLVGQGWNYYVFHVCGQHSRFSRNARLVVDIAKARGREIYMYATCLCPERPGRQGSKCRRRSMHILVLTCYLEHSFVLASSRMADETSRDGAAFHFIPVHVIHSTVRSKCTGVLNSSSVQHLAGARESGRSRRQRFNTVPLIAPLLVFFDTRFRSAFVLAARCARLRVWKRPCSSFATEALAARPDEVAGYLVNIPR